jgi:anthranilate/para-aminobenzoate synthase component I
MRRAVRLAVAPDPLGIARHLIAAGGQRLALLHAVEAGEGGIGRWSYVAVDPDLESDQLDPPAGCASEAWPGAWAAVPHWIGVVPYEALRDLERPGWSAAETRPPPRCATIRWLRYPAVVAVDHRGGEVFAVGEAAVVRGLCACLAQPRAPQGSGRVGLHVHDPEPAARHLERIEAARALIHRGDLYQVNLARAVELQPARGRIEVHTALALHERFARSAPSPLACCLDLGDALVVSSTPELLLRAEVGAPSAPMGPGSRSPEDAVGASGTASPQSAVQSRPFTRLLTVPIKGTRPRGDDADADEAHARALAEDPKEAAELTMIVDVERNDLGRVAVPGSVRLLEPPRVARHRTLFHRSARLVARVREGVSRGVVLRSMLPSGSVTGAPKVRAMEVIRELEASRRGLYTGAIGFVAHDQSLTLSMAIRTAVLGPEGGSYHVGGGIVADSRADRELEETRWKSLQLHRLVSS